MHRIAGGVVRPTHYWSRQHHGRLVLLLRAVAGTLIFRDLVAGRLLAVADKELAMRAEAILQEQGGVNFQQVASGTLSTSATMVTMKEDLMNIYGVPFPAVALTALRSAMADLAGLPVHPYP